MSTNKVSFIDKIKKFVIKYIHYILLAIFFIFLVVFLVVSSKFYRVGNKRDIMEDKYNKTLVDQIDFCSKRLKKYKLCEYFVNSSGNVGLSGYKKLDYIDLSIVEKVLRGGCRYLEIEVFNDTQMNDTNIVVSIGEEIGDWKLSKNSIKLDKFLKKIYDICFAQEYINNFMDPMFIFFNIKIVDNLDSMNKIYDIVQNTIGSRLLPKKYNYQNINIAAEPICNLMNKVVIMANKSFGESKFSKLINCSLEDNYLQRIKYSELIDNKDKKENIINTLPKAKITGKASYKKSIDKYYIEFEKNINLFELGFDKKLYYHITGSNINVNNTGNNLLTVLELNKNKLIFDTDVVLQEEQDVEITVRGYTFNNQKRIDYVNHNKSKLTIVIPDSNIMIKNYNPDTAWNKGCQFVTINFQSLDKYINIILNKFKNRSFILKPNNLLLTKSFSRKKSIDELYPNPVNNTKYDINYKFYQKSNKSIIIKPFNHSNARLINDNGVARVTINYTNNNSLFTIMKGLNGKPNSMSIMIGNLYLYSSDNCCYLSFKTPPADSYLRRQFNNDATFYPIKPINGKKKCVSFVTTKDLEYYKNRKNKISFDYKIPHYIKYKSKFNPKSKVYIQKTEDFKKIGVLKSSTGTISIWRPYYNNSYYPIGDYAVQGNKMPTFKGILVDGFTSFPQDYELIWNNMGNSGYTKMSIWRPIPYDGFIALGNVVVRSYSKPSLKAIKCIGSNYANEVPLGNQIWDNKGTTDKDTVSIWSIPGNNLLLTTPSFFKPNEFDTPVFNIIDKELDYNDRIYLSKRKNDVGEEDNLSFKFVTLAETTNNTYSSLDLDAIQNLKNSLDNDSYKIKKKYGKDKCISYDGAYWSPITRSEDSQKTIDIKNEEDLKDKITKDKPISIKDKLTIDNCKDGKYIGTNWIFNSDNTIRYLNNTQYCLTANLDDNRQPIMTHHGQDITKLKEEQGLNEDQISSLLSQDKQLNVVTLQKCKDDKNGQLFSSTWDGKLVYGGIDTLDSKACLTDSSKGYLRIEQCSNNRYQLWKLKTNNQDNCLSVGIIVYIKYTYPRGKKTWLSTRNNKIVGDKDYDSDNYHFYLKGEIFKKVDSYFMVDTLNGFGLKAVKENTEEIILDSIPESKEIKIGSKVLVRDEGLTISGLDDKNIMWEGIVIKKLNMNKFVVLLSNNAIELDENRDSLGRPRKPIIKEFSINKIRLINAVASCGVGG